MLSPLLVAMVLAISTGEAAPPPTDDEARIEELMGAEVVARETAVEAAAPASPADPTDPEAAPAPPMQFPPPPGTEIAFDDLPKMVGYPIRVHLGGRVRVGSVEKADKKAVTIRTSMGGGFASYTLARKQVDTIEAM